MHWQFTPYTPPLLVGSALLAIVVVIAWRRRSTQGAPYLILIGLSAIILALGYTLELSSDSVDDVRRWFAVEYLGATTVPIWLLLLSLDLTGRSRYVTPLTTALLLVVPGVTLLLAWTSNLHELIWADLTLKPQDDFYLADFSPGYWYWVNISYSLLVAASGLIILARALMGTSGLYHRQLGMLVIATTIPLAFYGLYAVGLAPENVDINPYAYILSGVVLAWALFNYQLFDIMPVAREAVLASMADAVIVLDTRNRVVDLNPVAQVLAGRNAQQRIGQPADQVFVQWAKIAGKHQDAEQAHDEITIDVYGERRSYDMRLSSLYDQGKHKGRMVVLRDITDRVQAEEALRETNRRLEGLRLVDSELSYKLHVDYVVTMAIDAAQRMSLADAVFMALAEEKGLRVVDFLGDYPTAIFNRLLPADTGINGRVIRNRRAELILDVSEDPDYQPLREDTKAQITIPLFSGEKLIGVINLEAQKPQKFTPVVFETIKLLASRIGVAIDNANLYEELEALVQELDAFAHTVAHDLKNPLSAVSTYAELTLMVLGEYPEEKIREFVESIQSSSKKAFGIIDALLMLAGVRSAAVKVGPINMRDIVHEVRTRSKTLIDEHQPEIVLPDSWPLAQGYAPWVEEIWANYFANALKYGGKPPRVELGYDLQDDHIRFWVRDNGAGLTREQQAKLFRPFTRLSTSESTEGHGLGLSIVQRIAERLNGEVGVESEIGKGSLFYFTLPAFAPKSDTGQ